LRKRRFLKSRQIRSKEAEQDQNTGALMAHFDQPLFLHHAGAVGYRFA
jgi:hypothetical protein